MFFVFSRHKMIQIAAFSILRCKITIFYGIDSLIIVKTARCSKKCIVLFLLRVLFLLEIVLCHSCPSLHNHQTFLLLVGNTSDGVKVPFKE